MSLTPDEIAVRWAYGHISEYALTSNDAYLVSEYPRQSDQLAGIDWICATGDAVTEGAIEESFRGTGKWYGGASITIKFAWLTSNMRNYMYTTLFDSKPLAPATVYVYNQNEGVGVVYNCYAEWTLVNGGAFEYRNEYMFTNVVFKFKRGIVAPYGRAFSSAFSSAFA